MEGRGGVMEGWGGGCEVAKVLHAKVLHTDRPSDEPGCSGVFAPKNIPTLHTMYALKSVQRVHISCVCYYTQYIYSDTLSINCYIHNS